MKYFLFLICFLGITQISFAQNKNHNLVFDKLASRWDEAMPLGNGMLGALIWQKGENLRLSLDRADLWDERKALDMSKLTFKSVEQQVLKKDYAPVQKIGDSPYDSYPYPTKLPAAAMEMNLSAFGKVISNELDIATAINTVKFESGAVFTCYIHAVQPIGYFSFENVPEQILKNFEPQLIIHNYNSGKSAVENDNSHAGSGLEKLGYEKGTVHKTSNSVLYRQPTYDDNFYEVLLQWQKQGNTIKGFWSIANNQPVAKVNPFNNASFLNSHLQWWKNFWKQSSVSLPDALIEKQYYLEMYKLGSASRKGAPAITLQAVWTADNGSLPPWKGDFHNDLNTQLSYWPVYTGNRLAEGETFIDWLWNMKDKNLNYTKKYFEVSGLNVPGVVTLGGDPMGGWIQYSMSPTVGAWTSHHFYMHWKYSMDKKFLTEKAYPYIQAVAAYLKNITRLNNGKRTLPLSSSPEYNNNDISAWFFNWTNFDLSLAKFLFKAAAETSMALNKKTEADGWLAIAKQLPDYDVNETGLTIAPNQNMNGSHRHLSQYMSIYPLALLDVNNAADKKIVDLSYKRIEAMGTRAWCGYSFSWMASVYARGYVADSAVRQLQIFASNFCSPNSFHLNGDQKGGQYSGFTYRPFTLEGNFAFAQGVHELLLQSRGDYIQVFPATPASWQNVAFENLRTEGAFLVSAKRNNGADEIKIVAEKGGFGKFKLPSSNIKISSQKNVRVKKSADGLITLTCKPGGMIVVKNS